MHTKFFITTKNGKVAGLSYDATANKFNLTEANYKMEAKNSRANILGELIEQMKLADSEEKSTTITFFIPGTLEQTIQRGSFRHWIETGKTLAGDELDKREIDLWIEFCEIYSKNFVFFNLKNISGASLKNNKYNKGVEVTQEEKIKDFLQDKAWTFVNKISEEQYQLPSAQ